MGDSDEPQRGFDHWVAFRGQGSYYPDGHGATRIVPQSSFQGFNINGRRVPQKGYITDELTDYALDWIDNRKNQAKTILRVRFAQGGSFGLCCERWRTRKIQRQAMDSATDVCRHRRKPKRKTTLAR